MRKIFNNVLLLAVLSVIVSCKGFLDRLPTDSVPAEKALVTMEDAAVAVNGLYTPLKYYTVYGTYMASMGDMRADNLYPREAGGNSTAIYASMDSILCRNQQMQYVFGEHRCIGYKYG